mmetsp:Transcript_110528/g.312659  ORF Transcript_110528/g.312659 Transcript_110528/m.312659 type:complete len:125 (-) Transcript_110528:32-406(-)
MTQSHYADFKKLQGRQSVAVVAFPCNQFGGQEPGTADQILRFAEGKGLAVNSATSNFWLMGKVEVNGPSEHPVYTFLKEHGGGGDIMWNFFTKFVVRCGESECDVSRSDGQMVPSSLVLKGGEL